MSTSGRKSPKDPGPARGRYGQRRDQNSVQGGSSLSSVTLQSPVHDTNGAETESRSSTPEVPSLDATSVAVPSAHEDPLPFPTRSTWRNLSIIFEGSESANSLSNDNVQPNKAPVSQPSNVKELASAKQKRRYSLPILSSLASKLPKTTVTDKIAYFEKATSPNLNSFLPVRTNNESRRHSLPSTLIESSASGSSVPFPAKLSHSDDTNLGNILHKGFLWYLNVHGPGAPKWMLCKASLYRTALVLTWQMHDKTTATATIDLLACLDVHSTRTVSDPSAADDIGAIAWRADRERGHDSVEDIYPMHLRWNDGVERIATSTLLDRVTWIGTILEFFPLRPPEQNAATTPRRSSLSPPPRLNSTPSTNESQNSTQQPDRMSYTTSFRSTNGHARTRSMGDVPKRPAQAMEALRSRLLRRVSSTSKIASRDFSDASQVEHGTTPTGSSPMTSISSRRRSISLKGIASLLSGRSSRADNLASIEDSELASPTPSRSRILLRSRSGSRESGSVVGGDFEGDKLGQLVQKRRASAPSRMRKPNPRLPRLARLTIESHRSVSDSQIPKMLEGMPTSPTMDTPAYCSTGSSAYQSAATSLPLTLAYYTASEGDTGEIEASQGPIEGPSLTPSDSMFITASDFTSSDAWMAHFTAASRLTSPRVLPHPRSRPGSRLASSRTMSSGPTLSHIFDATATPQPTSTAESIHSPNSVRPAAAPAHYTSASSMQDAIEPTDTTSGDAYTQTNSLETSILVVDEPSTEITDESPDYPMVPPPTLDCSPHTSLFLFGEATSSLSNNFALSIHATAPTTLSPEQPHTSEQTADNEISTQLDFTNSLQDVMASAIFETMRHEGVEYELMRVPQTSPSSSDATLGPTALLLHSRTPRRRLDPKREVSRMASTASMNSSIFLPSRRPSAHTIVPKTPSSVEVSLTPIQASVFPSPGNTISSSPDHTHEEFPDADPCEERLQSLLEFVERTRAGQTRTSGEFSEQLSRIEAQLAELGHLIRERLRASRLSTTGIDQPSTSRSERPLQFFDTFPLLPPAPGGSRSPTILFLSPPLSAVGDEITPTSAELPNTLTQLDVSNGTSTLPGPEAAASEEDTSSSLHLSLFPEVPRHRIISIGQSEPSIHKVSNGELRGMIEKLVESIETLITRQQIFNGALEGMQGKEVILEHNPTPNDSHSPGEILPRWVPLLGSLERFAMRRPGPGDMHDNFHHFLDSLVSRSSFSSVGNTEILRARPVPVGGIAVAYGHKLQAPRRRSHSHIGTTLTPPEESPFSGDIPRRPRARSLDDIIQTMADGPVAEGNTETNTERLTEGDTVGPLVGVPLVPRQRAPITRIWYRKPKEKKARVHWPMPPEAGTASLGSGIQMSEGEAQVSKLLQETRLQQEAATLQQNEIVRYLAELNGWLARDAVDRRAELRGLGDQLDDIHQTMMYGTAPALSLVVSGGPLPVFTPVSDQSSDHAGWFMANDDDNSTIIPPTPPRARNIPSTKPPNLHSKTSEERGNILPPILRILERKEQIAVMEGLLNEPHRADTSHPLGPRVTFQGPSSVQASDDNEPASVIRVLGDIASFPVGSPGGARGEIRGHQPPSNDEGGSRSRSRAVKPLTPDIQEVMANVPIVDNQSIGNCDPRVDPSVNLQPPVNGHHQKIDSRTLSAGGIRESLHEAPAPGAQSDRGSNGWGRRDDAGWGAMGETRGWGSQDHVDAWGVPSGFVQVEDSGRGWGSSPSRGTPHHTARRDSVHAIPHSHGTAETVHFLDGRKDDHTHRPTSHSRHSRRRSRNTRRSEGLVREPSTSENEARRGRDHNDVITLRRPSRSPEPSNRRRTDREFRRSGSKSPQYQEIYRHSSSDSNRRLHRRVRSRLTTSPPTHQTRPLPTVVTGLGTSNAHRSHRHISLENPHTSRDRATRFYIAHSPQSTYGHMSVTNDMHSPPEWTQTASCVDHLSDVTNPRGRVADVPYTSKTAMKGSYIMVSHPATLQILPQTVSREHDIHNPEPTVHIQASVTNFDPPPQVSNPRGARIQQPPEEEINLFSQATPPVIEAVTLGADSLRNVGYSAPILPLDDRVSWKDNTKALPGNPKPKKTHTGKKQVDNRLSVISEKSEPRISSPCDLGSTACGGQSSLERGLNASERTRNEIFLARQEERQRTLDKDARTETLAFESLLSDVEDSILANSDHLGDNNEVHPSPLYKRARELPYTFPLSRDEHGESFHVEGSRICVAELPSERRHLDSVTHPPTTTHLDTPSLSSRRVLATTTHSKAREVKCITQSSTQITIGGGNISTAHDLLKGKRSLPEVPNKYAQELAKERAKAQGLEAEIRKTRDAIQAIRDERAAVNERRHLDTLSTISNMQTEMQSRLQSITGQLLYVKNTGRDRGEIRSEELPDMSIEDGISGLVNQILEGQTAERLLKTGQRSAIDSQLALETELEQLRQENDAQKILIEDMLGKTTKQNRQQQTRLLEAFKRASTEQVKANVNEHLHEFTGAMTHEVRILLKEVGNLREQRRNLQHEIGCLLCFRSKMEPGGEFDASWDPAQGPPCTHFPPVGAEQFPPSRAPAFAGAMPLAGSKVSGLSVASTSKKNVAKGNAPQASAPGTSVEGRNAPSVHPIPPPPPFALPGPSNCGPQPREPGPAATQATNAQNTSMRPPPRASRKSRTRRAD